MNYSEQFDMLYAQAIIWFTKRKRFRYLKLDLYYSLNESCYAYFKVNNRISHIVLNKNLMIDFYKSHSITNSKSFKTFFISTIIHEMVHRNQWIRCGKSYSVFKREYDKNPKEYEDEAIQAELRYWYMHD